MLGPTFSNHGFEASCLEGLANIVYWVFHAIELTDEYRNDCCTDTERVLARAGKGGAITDGHDHVDLPIKLLFCAEGWSLSGSPWPRWSPLVGGLYRQKVSRGDARVISNVFLLTGMTLLLRAKNLHMRIIELDVNFREGARFATPKERVWQLPSALVKGVHALEGVFLLNLHGMLKALLKMAE
ncbi:Hypothetical predicted protein [Prunus dulcis]|uniref:Uncharacterized protein n=1 Tax=Prunus dulcis TaxID=3755 RepID=A0A5E4GE45_PRUDU|nr:Hypothetical predicted protein [Prunus dulcis]